MRIALGQVNPTVGDLAGNADLLVDVTRRAAAAGARLVVFPELSLTGYPPRDLVEKPSFVERTEEQLQRLARETADLDASLICGYVGRTTAQTGKTVTNSAAVIEGGKVVFQQS
jgi:NAD+ synthase (glutamine-hydrolysing)